MTDSVVPTLDPAIIWCHAGACIFVTCTSSVGEKKEEMCETASGLDTQHPVEKGHMRGTTARISQMIHRKGKIKGNCFPLQAIYTQKLRGSFIL